MSVEEAVVEKLRALPPERQQEVLEFTEELARRESWMDFTAQPSLEVLAEQQGVVPISNIDDLRADFWPPDEDVDDFLAAIRA